MPGVAELSLHLDRRLGALRKSRPDLADALALQEALIRADLASARRPLVESFALPREALSARVRNGVPLLHDQPVTVDIHFSADLFSRLVNTLQDHAADESHEQLSLLVERAQQGLLDPQSLFTEAFVQHRDHVAELAI